MSDIAAFPRIDRKTLNSLQEMLLQDIPRIISIVAGVVNNGPGGASAEEDSNNADSDGMYVCVYVDLKILYVGM